MCESEASSREHVPPLSLFPEGRDMGGVDYRKNLITVPSCELHNSAKSLDDEFLMVSLAGIIGNNSIGYMHKIGKVDRAIRRSSGRLLDNVLTKKKHIYKVEVENNKFIQVIWGTPDVNRLKNCFDRVARGLHVHHFNASFEGSIKLHLGFLFHEGKSPKNWDQFVRDKTEMELQGKPRYGDNPDVFFYQVTDKDEFGIFLMRLTFYGGVNVYVSFWPRDAKTPNHLGIELMNNGIKTIITLADKKYEIN